MFGLVRPTLVVALLVATLPPNNEQPAAGAKKPEPDATTAELEFRIEGRLEFTLHFPEGEGWERTSVPKGFPGGNLALVNQRTNAVVGVSIVESPTVADSAAKLDEVAANGCSRASKSRKVLVCENSRVVGDKADCLLTRYIDRPYKQLTPETTWVNTHYKICQFGRGRRRMVTILYVYPWTGQNDPLQPEIQRFFQSLEFK